ncbi:MAG: GNAT family N-acetyltransferase [Hyphomicrobiaceae bacterium]
MSEIVVRSAVPEDIPAIAAVYRPAVLHGTASFELVPPSEGEMLSRFTAIVSGGFPYLAAETDGAVVGYAYASAYRPRPAYRFSVEDSIYIAPQMQSKGVGRRLLEALVGRCTELGFRQMIAVIGDSRQYASIALHRRAGFLFTGTMHAIGYKHGRWLDCVIMQRDLGAGDRTPPADDRTGRHDSVRGLW